MLPYLSVRLDGVALLAEARAHEHASGRFHELVRLFEATFRRAGKGRVNPLTEFLASTDLDYTRQEIVVWIQQLRHGLTLRRIGNRSCCLKRTYYQCCGGSNKQHSMCFLTN